MAGNWNRGKEERRVATAWGLKAVVSHLAVNSIGIGYRVRIDQSESVSDKERASHTAHDYFGMRKSVLIDEIYPKRLRSMDRTRGSFHLERHRK